MVIKTLRTGRAARLRDRAAHERISDETGWRFDQGTFIRVVETRARRGDASEWGAPLEKSAGEVMRTDQGRAQQLQVETKDGATAAITDGSLKRRRRIAIETRLKRLRCRRQLATQARLRKSAWREIAASDRSAKQIEILRAGLSAVEARPRQAC